MVLGERNSNSGLPDALVCDKSHRADPRSANAAENRRVLAVDDDPNVTEGIRCNVRAPFTVVTVNSGSQALERLSHSEPFAVILSDLRMPGMDGIELLRRVREEFPTMIRIVLSGTADMATTVQAVNSGGIHHLLLKPTPPEELRRVLELACREYNQKAREVALALEDPLLGIGTRRALEKALLRVHGRAIRHQGTYALAMIDVDNFKRYNDSYGHLAGDRALCKVAQALSCSCRASDEAFRFGGEELVLVMSETDECGGATVCERVRSRIQELRIPHRGSDSGLLTISVGIASSSPMARPEWPEILERADRALYEAKSQGRNRVVTWQAVCTPDEPE